MSAVETAAFMTVEGVEIAHVGMEWPSASGPITLTFQHLADAVTAANDDPHILPPRLKIGHEDPRFNEDPPVHDPFAYHGPLREDGNPVYGKATNLRLAEDGMVLLGDYVEVPTWLGNALPSAYPSRSLEGEWDVETEGGKRYSFVITAVALLGENLPAITCLDDLVRELSGGPEAVTAAAPVTLGKEARMPVQAEAAIDSVFQQFVSDYAQGERYWWWPCEIRVEDGWVLADDDEGHFYRVSFTTDADGNVVFGDPARGVLDFREVADPDKEPVAASRGVRLAARPKDRVRPVAATVDQGGTMNDEQKALAVKLGLGDDATVEQLNEKLQADALAAETEEPKPEGEPEPEPQPEPEAAGTREPVAATVTVSEEVWKQTNTRLSTLEQRDSAREQAETKTRRDGIVAAALQDGRITPSEHGHYRSMLEVDEEKTSKLLASLAAGRVPVAERGSAPAQGSETAELGWFPQFERTKETVNG